MVALSKTGWVLRMAGAGGLVLLVTACVPGQFPFRFPRAATSTATLPARPVVPTQTPTGAAVLSPTPPMEAASATPVAAEGSLAAQASSVDPDQALCGEGDCEPSVTAPADQATEAAASPTLRPTLRPRTSTPRVIEPPSATPTSSPTSTSEPTVTAQPVDVVDPTTPPIVAAPTDVRPTAPPAEPTTAPSDGYPGPGQPEPTSAPTEVPPTPQPGGYPGPGDGGGYPAP